MRYRFIPTLPTKEAYDKKAFPDFNCETAFLEGLKKKDLGDNLHGYIYFKDGIISSWSDGTETITKDTRKWWELGYTSCSKGCCVIPPFPTLKEDGSDQDLADAVKEHLQMVEQKSRPMPKFKSEVIPHNRGWQEFKRVSGPGGLEEQLSLIEDKTTIRKICFINYGGFVLE